MKFYLISFLLFSSSISAHRKITSQTNVNGFDGSLQYSYGGYGYVYKRSPDIKSEAAAYALGDFNCQEFQRSTSDDIICESGDCYTGQVSALYNSSVNVHRKAKIQATFDKLRDKALEFFALNLKSATSGSSNQFDPNVLSTPNSGGFCPRESKAPKIKSPTAKPDTIDFMAPGGKMVINSPKPPQTCFCKLSPTSDLGMALKISSGTNSYRTREKQKVIDQGMEPLSMVMAVLARERSVSVMGIRPKRPGAIRRHFEMGFFRADVSRAGFYDYLGEDSRQGDNYHGDGDRDCRKYGRSFRKGRKMSAKEREYRNDCQAWGAELYRLETNFPHLYRRPNRTRLPNYYDPNIEDADAIFDYQVSVKRNGKYKAEHRPGLLTAAKEIFELTGGSWSGLMENVKGYGSDHINQFKKNYEEALKILNDPKRMKRIGSDGRKLRKAFRKIRGAANRIKSKFGERIRKFDLPRLCKTKDEKELMSWLFSAYPNVIRQLMIDLKPDERVIMRKIFCRNGFGERLAHGDQCVGVTGGPLPGPKPIKVRRKSAGNLLKGNDNVYEISQATPDSPRVLKMKINLIPGPNTKNPQALQNFAAKLRSDANKYFNCQFGNPPPSYTDPSNENFTCPAGPNMNQPPGLKVELDFNLRPKGTKPVKPYLYVHECFRSELSVGSGGLEDASNCKKVHKYALEQCIKYNSGGFGALLGNRVKQFCRSKYPRGSASNNRENAANLTTTSHLGDVRHEIFHLMGLNDDEYVDEGMQFNPIGEEDSLMRKGKQAKPRLYPRHVKRVVSPLRCVKRRLR